MLMEGEASEVAQHQSPGRSARAVVVLEHAVQPEAEAAVQATSSPVRRIHVQCGHLHLPLPLSKVEACLQGQLLLLQSIMLYMFHGVVLPSCHLKVMLSQD